MTFREWANTQANWINGKPLISVIEPYRLAIFDRAFDPGITMVVTGRGKKNWKTADLVSAALYRLTTGLEPQGTDCAILASDEGQAADDLVLAKKIVEASPRLKSRLVIRDKEIRRVDGRGSLTILPAGDVAGLHGKTFSFIGFDEIHTYKNYDVLEALSPDPTRHCLTWVASYASIHNKPGIPLYDMVQRGKTGTDTEMLFDWHSAAYCTCPDACEGKSPEERANPSMSSWTDKNYLSRQRKRLPGHKFRRLHLNMPGTVEGAYLNAELLETCVAKGQRERKPPVGVRTYAFVDMSGGSIDDAVLAMGWFDATSKHYVIGKIIDQGQVPPFDPNKAVRKFAAAMREWGISLVEGDAYAGQTFRTQFAAAGITYRVHSCKSASETFSLTEPFINQGLVEFPDEPKLYDQMLGLVSRGTRGDHPVIAAPNGEHDDFAAAACGLIQSIHRGRTGAGLIRMVEFGTLRPMGGQFGDGEWQYDPKVGRTMPYYGLFPSLRQRDLKGRALEPVPRFEDFVKQPFTKIEWDDFNENPPPIYVERQTIPPFWG